MANVPDPFDLTEQSRLAHEGITSKRKPTKRDRLAQRYADAVDELTKWEGKLSYAANKWQNARKDERRLWKQLGKMPHDEVKP